MHTTQALYELSYSPSPVLNIYVLMYVGLFNFAYSSIFNWSIMCPLYAYSMIIFSPFFVKSSRIFLILTFTKNYTNMPEYIVYIVSSGFLSHRLLILTFTGHSLTWFCNFFFPFSRAVGRNSTRLNSLLRLGVSSRLPMAPNGSAWVWVPRLPMAPNGFFFFFLWHLIFLISILQFSCEFLGTYFSWMSVVFF